MPRENLIVSDGVVHRWGVIESEEARRANLTTAEGMPGVKRIEIHLGCPGIIPTYVAETGDATQSVEASLNLSEHICAADYPCYRPRRCLPMSVLLLERWYPTLRKANCISGIVPYP